MGVSRQCCLPPHLPLKHYCMMLLPFDTPSFAYSAKDSFDLLVKPTE